MLRAAGKSSPVAAEIGKQVIQEYQAHADETGTRVNNKNWWVHVLCTSALTFLALHEKRGKIAMDDIRLLKQFHGILTHDCWSSYWSCEGNFLHSVCCAHLLRELNGVMENYPEQKWAKKLSMLLIEMKKIRDTMAESGYTALRPCYLDKCDEVYDDTIRLALDENPLPENPLRKRGRRKKGKVRALIERLQKYKGEVCLFVKDFAVLLDNNQAERDIRMEKQKPKYPDASLLKKVQNLSSLSCHMWALLKNMVSTHLRQF